MKGLSPSAVKTPTLMTLDKHRTSKTCIDILKKIW